MPVHQMYSCFFFFLKKLRQIATEILLLCISHPILPLLHLSSLLLLFHCLPFIYSSNLLSLRSICAACYWGVEWHCSEASTEHLFGLLSIGSNALHWSKNYHLALNRCIGSFSSISFNSTQKECTLTGHFTRSLFSCVL